MSAVSASSIRREEDAAGPGGRPLDKVRALHIPPGPFAETADAYVSSGSVAAGPDSQPGAAGEFWPLSIPTVADRVVMTAAKLVLEPVFEAQFTEANYGSGRSGPRSTHAKLCVSPRTSGGSGCSRPISATDSARSTMRR